MKQILIKPGQFIFKENDPATCLYLIRSGSVSIQKSTENGPIEVSKVGPNQVIGEMAFFDRKARSADVVALSDVELIEIPFESLDPIFGPAPDYLKKIMTSLAERLRDADNSIADLKDQMRSLMGNSSKNMRQDIKEKSPLEKVLDLTKSKK